MVYAKDKFGESGLISVIILISDETEIKIDTFLMSCRVMGRKLENVIFNELLDALKDKYTKIYASYLPTAKNIPVRELYEKLDFTLILDSSKEKKYEKDLTEYQKKRFDIYKDIRFEE